MALALALNVSLGTLLMPESAGDQPVELTERVAVTGSTAWAWAEGKRTAADWEPGEGTSLAAPGADPAIGDIAYEAELEFLRQQAAYQELSGPVETRQASRHQASRLAQATAELTTYLVAALPHAAPDDLRTLARMVRRRIAQLTIELDEIEDSVTEYETKRVETFREPGRVGQRYGFGRKDGTGPEYTIETWKEDAGTSPPQNNSDTDDA